MAPIEELVVAYDPTQVHATVERRRRGMVSRLVSLGVTVVVLLLLYRFGGTRLQGAGFLAVYGIALVISLAWFVGYLVAYLLARRELGTLGSGTAIRIGRAGVEVAGAAAPWPEVVALTVVRGGPAAAPGWSCAAARASRRPYRSTRSRCTRPPSTAPRGPTPPAGTGSTWPRSRAEAAVCTAARP